MIAETGSPTVKPSCLTLAEVIIEVTVLPPESSMVTSSLTAPGMISMISLQSLAERIRYLKDC